MHWESLEDLPTESKNHPRVLELRLECLGVLKEWQKTVILGEGLVAVLPNSALVRFWLACGLAQTGRHGSTPKRRRGSIQTYVRGCWLRRHWRTCGESGVLIYLDSNS